MLRTLRPIADAALSTGDEQLLTDFDTYVSDFCEGYTEVLPQRKLFVEKLSNIEDYEEFQTACFTQLAAQPTLNKWYDPIDPLSSIT